MFCLLPSLGACNMLISDTATFSDEDRAQNLPRDGIWLSQEQDCAFNSGLPEASWPDCAMWVVVRGAETEFVITDGKGQSESIGGLLATGNPIILQGRWIDTAKSPHRAYYGFYGIDAQEIGTDGRLLSVSAWPVECGIQKSGSMEIEPFAGIGPDCHAPSRDAVRAAAKLSRRPDQISKWRWLRNEAPQN